MKFQLPALFLGLILLASTLPSPADSSDAAKEALASVSAQDKIKFIKARKQVLASHPDLQAEQDQISKQKNGLKNASPEDKKAFLQTLMAHQKKMKEEMLKVDPSLAPVFDQIQQQMKQKMEQRMASGAGN